MTCIITVTRKTYETILIFIIVVLSLLLIWDFLDYFSSRYENVFQAIASLGIFIIPLTWWQWKKKEKEALSRSLSSISVIDIDASAIAVIKNTSNIDGSILFIKIYKPFDFERFEKNGEFLKYVAGCQEHYAEKKKNLIKFGGINWAEPALCAKLSIGESLSFHLKDVQEVSKFVHFAPVKIEISLSESDNEEKPIIKYMLFEYASSELRTATSADDFMKNQLHPYNKWHLIFSK